MDLFIVIGAVVLLSLCASNRIKKYGKGIYALSAFISLAALVWQFGPWREDAPDELIEWIILGEKYFLRGIIATGIFIVVMWTGALNPKKSYTKKLLKVRAEWSVIGGMFIIPHIISRAVLYWPPSELRPAELFLYIDGILCLVLLIPLWLTSFIPIRRKMPAKAWKRLQKLAYPFYALIGLHGIILHFCLSGVQPAAWAYVCIFGLYLVKRIHLALTLKKSKKY